MGLGGSGGMDGTHADDSGKRGEGRPNAYFIEQGLFTMTIAHAAISQSRRGTH